MPVSFSYSGERVLTKKSSKPLMNELSWTTVIDCGAAPTRRGASAAAPPARAVVRNSRRVLMGRPPLGAGGMRASSLFAGQNQADARDLRRTDRTDRLQALAACVPPRMCRSGVCGTLGPAARPVKVSGALFGLTGARSGG